MAQPELTDADYDALYDLVRENMPRITRETFPDTLVQLQAQGLVKLVVTDTEIAVTLPGQSVLNEYRIGRKRRPDQGM